MSLGHGLWLFFIYMLRPYQSAYAKHSNPGSHNALGGQGKKQPIWKKSGKMKGRSKYISLKGMYKLLLRLKDIQWNFKQKTNSKQNLVKDDCKVCLTPSTGALDHGCVACLHSLGILHLHWICTWNMYWILVQNSTLDHNSTISILSTQTRTSFLYVNLSTHLLNGLFTHPFIHPSSI